MGKWWSLYDSPMLLLHTTCKHAYLVAPSNFRKSFQNKLRSVESLCLHCQILSVFWKKCSVIDATGTGLLTLTHLGRKPANESEWKGSNLCNSEQCFPYSLPWHCQHSCQAKERTTGVSRLCLGRGGWRTPSQGFALLPRCWTQLPIFSEACWPHIQPLWLHSVVLTHPTHCHL